MNSTKAPIERTSLIRLGGLVAMVTGALYVAAEMLNLPDGVGGWIYYGLHPGGGSLFYNALLVGAMAATLAIAALYALRRERDSVRGVLVSVVVFFGVALMLWGELGEDPVAAVLGLLVGSVGALMLGGVTMSIGVRRLPWWCGVALIVWGLALLLWMLPPVLGVLGPAFPASWGWVVMGVPWITVGFGVFRAASPPSVRPSRVQ